MNTSKQLWDDTFTAISNGEGSASFGNDFGSGFGLGVIDLIPPPSPPHDVPPPIRDGSTSISGFGAFTNPFAATPGATPEEQKTKDKALLVKVALGGAGVLALLALLGGNRSAPVSVPTATAPAPRPGNINIRLDRSTFFGKRKKK